MFNEINAGDVIINILISLITSHVITNLKIKRFLDLLDKQTISLMDDIKMSTIEIVKKYK